MSARLHIKTMYRISMHLAKDGISWLRFYLGKFLSKIASKSKFTKLSFALVKKYFQTVKNLSAKKPFFTFAIIAIILHIIAIVFYISFYKLRNQHYKFGSFAIISTSGSGFNLVTKNKINKQNNHENQNIKKEQKNQETEPQNNQNINSGNVAPNSSASTDSSILTDDAFVSYSIGSSKNPAPHYPKTARERGLYGKVEIITYINPISGKVLKASVLKSSGHKSLDGSALSAISKWTFDIDQALNSSTLKQKNELVIVVPVSFTLI